VVKTILHALAIKISPIAEANALTKKPLSHEAEMTPKIIKNPKTKAIRATKQK
jgi:hypothetical protein